MHFEVCLVMITYFYVIYLQACYFPQRQENAQLFCIPETRNDFTYVGTKILQASYFFFLLKVVDMLDTIFFILRKKNNQVTFLHIYHHAGMVVAGYFYFKIYSGGGYAIVLGKVLSLQFLIKLISFFVFI